MKRLENKIVVITGVSAGIGRASALLFAEEGATVIGADIDEVKGAEVETAIREAGGEGHFVKADVSKQEDVAKVFAKAKELGGIDVLFNNAGVEVVKSLPDTTEEEWDRSVSVNLKSVYLCTKHALPQMEKKGKGVIISNSSAAGLVGSFSPSYSAAKGGIISLTKALAVDLGPSNIRVNCICPGAIETPMLERVIKMQGNPREVRERRLKNYPIGRFGDAEEVAYAALFLASDESSFITGAVLPVDGGFTSH
ncbi:MAG: SDR family NAD(P)-dependent oxidoreductase [Candidatus Thorarchaeota archaeon]|jgi:NAD(P)-dependent dehydrogenase (short-subunit alcohol dehydrogenase family)